MIVLSERKTRKLAGKLSDELTQALEDLESCEASPNYEIDMGHWHVGRKEGDAVCVVCLAGAYLAQTGKANIALNLSPADMSNKMSRKMSALNKLRMGKIELALDQRSASGRWSRADRLENVGLPSSLAVTGYEEDPDQFKQHMREFAELLRACAAGELEPWKN